MTKINLLLEWAIANDMVTGDIVLRQGMRHPIDAHKMAIRYQLAHQDGNGVDFGAIRALPGGMYNGWKYLPHAGATNDEIKEQAKQLYKDHGGQGAAAAAGFARGDTARRAPLDSSGRGPGVSQHCSGHAVDVFIPWRSDKDPNHTDEWAWEEIYHQFGLLRPLHKDLGFTGSKAEHWHVEETGKNIDGNLNESEDA
ncbi:MAG: D-alanyl-D-alanine carboxypeptidase family protein [Proteobacteria bacterium]|nr:D-alanyl-D-alanine carboxypeptidase family protein [Pseudomonadota bacterium]